MASQEHNRAAVLESPHARLSMKNRPVPPPGANEVLVRNHAIAVNPIDWMMQDYNMFISRYPLVLGCDISGVVSAVGKSVDGIETGDRVCGFGAALCNSNIDQGAFQTYTILHDFAIARLPPAISFEEGSILPCAAVTATLGLFVNLDIPRPDGTSSSAAVEGDIAIIVWGGASSIGSMAIQIAKKIGLTVIATASSSHHEYLKSLGATAVVDYKSPDVVSDISNTAKGLGKRLMYAFDCVSKGETFSQCAQVLSNTLHASGKQKGGMKLATVLPWPDELPKPDGMNISSIMVLELEAQHRELSRWIFREWLPTALADGSIVPSPQIEIFEGGLEKTQEALEKHKAGVSGKKLVLQVS